MSSVVGAAGGFNAYIPENLLVIRDNLKEHGGVTVAATISIRVRVIRV